MGLFNGGVFAEMSFYVGAYSKICGVLINVLIIGKNLTQEEG